MDGRLLAVANWFSSFHCIKERAANGLLPCDDCISRAEEIIALVKSFDNPSTNLGIYCGEDIGQKM